MKFLILTLFNIIAAQEPKTTVFPPTSTALPPPVTTEQPTLTLTTSNPTTTNNPTTATVKITGTPVSTTTSGPINSFVPSPANTDGSLNSQTKLALIIIAAAIGGLALLALLFFIYNKCLKNQKDDDLIPSNMAVNSYATRPFDNTLRKPADGYQSAVPYAYQYQHGSYAPEQGGGYIVTTSPQQVLYADGSGAYYQDTGDLYDPNYDSNYHQQYPQELESNLTSPADLNHEPSSPPPKGDLPAIPSNSL